LWLNPHDSGFPFSLGKSHIAHALEVFGILDFFCKQVGNVLFAFNMADIDVPVLLGLLDAKFAHVDVAQFLRDRDAFSPVYASIIIVPNGSRNCAVGEAKIL
jgi:hypothetical protein